MLYPFELQPRVPDSSTLWNCEGFPAALSLMESEFASTWRTPFRIRVD